MTDDDPEVGAALLPKPDEGDEENPVQPWRRLCGQCSTLPIALCERCRRLVASGRNLGPLPSFALEKVDSSACMTCKGHFPDAKDGSRARFCVRHGTPTRRAHGPSDSWERSPVEPHGLTMTSRPHWFA